jgi:rubredoxin
VANSSDKCRKCGSAKVEGFSTLHHYLCSYVGPQYDFGKIEESIVCPKCKLALKKEFKDWELVGFCRKCLSCGDEIIDNSYLSGTD